MGFAEVADAVEPQAQLTNPQQMAFPCAVAQAAATCASPTLAAADAVKI